MIQASTTKHIEPKALKSVEGKSASKQAPKDLAGSLEAKEFAGELEASMATGVEVKPVEVSAEQALPLPSMLVSPEAINTGSVETTTPKIFDPALTQDVATLIQPKMTDASQVPTPELTDADVLQLAQGEVVVDGKLVAVKEVKGEIAQALLKTPQVAQMNGRAPAIEFAQAEVDPQLMNNEDFVAQKNLATKKVSQGQAYGMKPQQQKIALENGLNQTQIVKDATAGSASSEANGSSVNSQQFILNMMNEQKGSTQTNEVQVAPKVFDMGQIKSSDANQVINQITDYVVQAKAAKEPTVNMRVNHEELGMIDITVSKAGVNHETIAINIGAHSAEGKNFFQQNSKDLFSHLASAGLTVSDLKVETPQHMAKNDFDFNSQAGRQQHGEKQFGSEQNQRRHEQERRQDLWKLFNQEAA